MNHDYFSVYEYQKSNVCYKAMPLSFFNCESKLDFVECVSLYLNNKWLDVVLLQILPFTLVVTRRICYFFSGI